MKDRVRSFWDANPCGKKNPSSLVGTAGYFEEVSTFRYSRWSYLPTLCEFSQHREEKMLEIGCGMGIDGQRFIQGGAIYTGIDLSPVSLALAKRYLRIERLYVADAEDLPFPSSSFDFVYSHGVLHHTPNPTQAISQIHKVLGPGGKFIIMLYKGGPLSFLTWNSWRWSWKLRRKDYTREEIKGASTDGLGNPLSKLYTKEGLRRLFYQFRSLTFQTRYFPSYMIPGLGAYLDPILSRVFGGYWYIKGQK